MKRIAVVVAAALALLAGVWLSTRERQPVWIGYRQTVEGESILTAEGEDGIKTRALAELDYRLAHEPGAVAVALDRMNGVATTDDGREVEYRMDRSGASSKTAGKSKGFRREGATPGQLRSLDQFGATLAVISLDAEGGETARKEGFTSGPIVEARALDTLRFFHPRFPPSLATWDAEVSIPNGKAQLAAGTLRYTKRPGSDRRGVVMVEVVGELRVAGKIGRFPIQRGVWRVKGEQAYDPSLGDWISGNLRVETDSVVVTPDEETLLARGSVTISLSRLGEQDGAR
jgi:hypothetical protein